jgi:hypothetical protein
VNSFQQTGRYDVHDFLDDLFFLNKQRESIAKAFQKALRSSKGIRDIKFVVDNIRPDVWEAMVVALDDDRAVKSKTGTRTEDIATDEKSAR